MQDREGEPKYDDLEQRLAESPVIAVPTITLEGDANGEPHPDGSSCFRFRYSLAWSPERRAPVPANWRSTACSKTAGAGAWRASWIGSVRKRPGCAAVSAKATAPNWRSS